MFFLQQDSPEESFLLGDEDSPIILGVHTAISCVQNASASSAQQVGGFELFVKYVANEIRAISSSQPHQWIKLQIQTLLSKAQTEASSASRPMFHPMSQTPVCNTGTLLIYTTEVVGVVSRRWVWLVQK